MIRSVLVMKPKPGCAAAVVDHFQEQGIIEKALSVEGCEDVAVLTSDSEILVTATWIDAGSYQAWLDHPERNASSDELNVLLQSAVTADTIGGLYEVSLTGSAEKGMN